ncbi:DUF1622 domain-containing protein [Allopontixanthobacter sediminis]|nr:DUF1622 domain-containing protein [Allopontixanthobacter sediminis]
MIEVWLREMSLGVSLAVEGIAAVVVAYAVAEAVIRLLFSVSGHSGNSSADQAHNVKEEIRLRLGRWLALALELLLGADILRTAVAPSWSEIGQLAAIAAIRTALNYFLQKEIESGQKNTVER